MNLLQDIRKRIVSVGLLSLLIFTSLIIAGCSKDEENIKEQTLMELPYSLLPIGEVQPQGWLRHTLKAMCDGMTGHLDELWEDVGPNCGWIGGSGPAWERPVYWLDGLVPLAYILDDKILIEKGQKYIEWILNSQREDGFFGQVEDTTRKFGENERYLAYVEKMKED
ncbi:MAG: hypothetical protein KAX28_09320 [Candidatus Marinimicrobia bacterium]|nr:hypothetical protein [Candidatus Neomarinimicrobiota bacterium]